MYDPRAMGAECHRCPLAMGGRASDPVGPESHPGARIALVGEAPANQDVQVGRPFVGPSGIEQMKAIEKGSWRRSDFHWTNAIACKPPGAKGDLNFYLMRLKSKNRKRKRKGLEVLPTPMECCKPRLDRELAGFGNIIALGAFAAKAVIPGHKAGILDIRGGPVKLDSGVKVLPTLHPAFVLRATRWREAYHIDHERARRWFDDQLDWADPQIIYRPTVKQLADFLGVEWTGRNWVANPAKSRPLAWDYETDGVESLDCKVRCIGIGTAGYAVVVPFLGVDGRTRFYTPAEHAQVDRVLKAWMVGPGLKIGHNSGYYNSLVA